MKEYKTLQAPSTNLVVNTVSLQKECVVDLRTSYMYIQHSCCINANEHNRKDWMFQSFNNKSCLVKG